MLVALARFGGARIPSEMRQMKWADLNFEAGKMTLWSPKTERYPNRRSRLVPIAPELAVLFAEAFAAAPEGSTYVFPRLRHTTNHVTSTDKLIRRAGLEPWPRTFDNLRASCEVDWMDLGVPEHVVCAWMGHSRATARKHYVRPTEQHFRKVSGGAPTDALASGNNRKSYEQPNANPSEKQAVSQSDWLPRDRNPGRNSNEIATSAAKGVRQTVRDLSKVTRAGRLNRRPNLRRSLAAIASAAGAGGRHG
jgi:hypothetical protein